MKQRAYKVLIVDDSEDDRFFMRQTIGRFARFQLIGEARDGDEAIDYLAGNPPFADREKNPFPDLMLLDLKMPRVDGFEVLQWLAKNSFPSLTVIVLSSSNLAQDVGASLALGAHGFWTKTAQIQKQDLIAEEIEMLLDKRTANC